MSDGRRDMQDRRTKAELLEEIAQLREKQTELYARIDGMEFGRELLREFKRMSELKLEGVEIAHRRALELLTMVSDNWNKPDLWAKDVYEYLKRNSLGYVPTTTHPLDDKGMPPARDEWSKTLEIANICPNCGYELENK